MRARGRRLVALLLFALIGGGCQVGFGTDWDSQIDPKDRSAIRSALLHEHQEALLDRGGQRGLPL